MVIRVFRQVFQEWWTGRDKWFTNIVKIILLGIYIGGLGMFFGFGASYSNNGWISQIGFPSPWFVLHHAHRLITQENVGPGWEFRQGSGTEIRFIASSWLAAAIGFNAYYIYWRIRRAETGEQSKFRFPRWHVGVWTVLGVVAFIACLSVLAY